VNKPLSFLVDHNEVAPVKGRNPRDLGDPSPSGRGRGQIAGRRLTIRSSKRSPKRRRLRRPSARTHENPSRNEQSRRGASGTSRFTLKTRAKPFSPISSSPPVPSPPPRTSGWAFEPPLKPLAYSLYRYRRIALAFSSRRKDDKARPSGPGASQIIAHYRAKIAATLETPRSISGLSSATCARISPLSMEG